jgi:hypothetical protein
MNRKSAVAARSPGSPAAAGFAGALAVLACTGVQAQTYQYDLRPMFSTEARQDRLQPGGSFEARVESAVMMIGNINLAEDPEDEIDSAAIELAPGFYASYMSGRAQGEIDYTLIGRWFEADEYDSVTHRLAADGSVAVVHDLLFVSGHAGYDQAIIDPARSFNYGNSGLFASQNLTDVANASIVPTLNKEWSHVELNASYSYGRTWYFEDDEFSAPGVFTAYDQDSEDQTAMVSLGTRDEGRESSLRGFYEWQASDYDISLPYRYERAGLETSLRLSRTFSFVADGGVETDLLETTTEGGLDAEYWHVGLRWEPDERSHIEARYGDRFFGDSYEVSASRRVRQLTMTLSYIEDPTVETRTVSSAVDPGGPPIPDLPGGQGAFNSEPYVRKDGRFVAIVEGRRTNVRLDVYDLERDYLRELLPGEHTTGTTLTVVRDFGSELYGELQMRYEDIERGSIASLPGGGEVLQFHDYDRDAMLRLNWEAYVNFMASAEVGWLARSGDSEYDGEWIALRLRYTF